MGPYPYPFLSGIGAQNPGEPTPTYPSLALGLRTQGSLPLPVPLRHWGYGTRLPLPLPPQWTLSVNGPGDRPELFEGAEPKEEPKRMGLGLPTPKTTRTTPCGHPYERRTFFPKTTDPLSPAFLERSQWTQSTFRHIGHPDVSSRTTQTTFFCFGTLVDNHVSS